MYHKVSNFTLKISTFIALLLLLGCTTSPLQTSDMNDKIEIISPKHIKISNVMIIEKPDSISIKGRLREKHLLEPKPRGHIEINVVDSNGHILHKTATRFHRLGKADHSKQRYNFSAKLPYKLPEGGIIRVTYHESMMH